MRQVLSLSFPQEAIEELKAITKERGFNSVSSYIKYLFESDKDLISEKELLEDVRIAEKEYKAGKTIKARSLADLV